MSFDVVRGQQGDFKLWEQILIFCGFLWDQRWGKPITSLPFHPPRTPAPPDSSSQRSKGSVRFKESNKRGRESRARTSDPRQHPQHHQQCQGIFLFLPFNPGLSQNGDYRGLGPAAGRAPALGTSAGPGRHLPSIRSDPLSWMHLLLHICLYCAGISMSGWGRVG